MKNTANRTCTPACSASARSAAAFCCCAESARIIILMDAALLASILICLCFSLRLSILVLVGLYVIITLVWNRRAGWKSLLQGE